MPVATKKKKKEEKSRASIHDQVAAALKRLEAKDPGLKPFLKKAHGYVVFPSVGTAAVVVGGGYGKGLVFEKSKPVGYATIGKMTLGVDLGGSTLTEVIAFESRQVFERFRKGRFGFDADASAVLVKAGASGTADYEKGAVAFAYSSGGLKLQAAIGGQKFKFKPLSAGDEQDEDDKDDDKSGEEEGDGAEASGKGVRDKGEEGEEQDEGEGEASDDDDEEEADEDDEDEEDEGDEEDEDDGPSLEDRAGAGLKAARHLKKAVTGGRIGKAIGLAGAGASSRWRPPAPPPAPGTSSPTGRWSPPWSAVDWRPAPFCSPPA